MVNYCFMCLETHLEKNNTHTQLLDDYDTMLTLRSRRVANYRGEKGHVWKSP